MTTKLSGVKVSSVVRAIFYNLLVFFVLANAFYWSIPVVGWLSDLGKNNDPKRTGIYVSFIEWRSSAYQSAGLNIGGPYLQRRTLNYNKTPEKQVYFFGGSTMWGVGPLDDGATIPSQFAALTGMHAENFAEIGWTAHQSLIYLLQILQDGNRPDVVVFFDGVNDVVAKCPIGHTPTSHGQESEFRSLLNGSHSPSSFNHYFKGVMRLGERVHREIFKSTGGSKYDCTTDAEKADAIATNMVRDWQLAKQLAELYGAKFIGILQPVAYFSRTPVGSLNLPEDLGRQFKNVYPLMRQRIAGRPTFYDFGSIFDVDEQVYVDFCHVNPPGSHYIAQGIANLVESKER